jgi:oxygen-independent coproporphyrinogen-3 oxidase
MSESTEYPEIGADPATTRTDRAETEVGSVFVSNYPAYSFWGEEDIPLARQALASSPHPDARLGLYLHIPFCRKRCKFCYFRVYTDKNSDQIQTYLDALAHEVELCAQMPAVADRPLHFVYFGGGTPSYISSVHLRALVARLKDAMPWDNAAEIAFECEPGTLTRAKLEAIRQIGVTRLSLGLENLDDEILRHNGRAHVSKEIYQVMPWIEELDFDQVNVDLIAGMVGETWESWRQTVQKTIDLNPDSVTIYQMELPYNTVYSKDLLSGSGEPLSLADWETKRAWHAYAFELFAAAGYTRSSAYTMKKTENARFVYRDAVWTGQDMIGTGVASFSHMSGVHYQNAPRWEDYLGALDGGQLPLYRAFATNREEQLTRELILQLKLGALSPAYFRTKFGVDIIDKFGPTFAGLRDEGLLDFDADGVALKDEGLLRIDQLLPDFYETKYRNARYT